MKDVDNNIIEIGKNKKLDNRIRAKSFGYQVLGFGSGGAGSKFIVATGGTITEDGDFRIHTFTTSGCFVVCSAGTPTCCGGDGSYVDYLVVASGGNGPGNSGGGGGGVRSSNRTYPQASNSSGTGATDGILVTAQTYPIVVGAPSGTRGGTSSFGPISSTGGGEGGGGNGGHGAFPGGSGGGGGHRAGSGTGNTPPVSPPQGSNGGGPIGTSIHNAFGGAGGGGLIQSGSGSTAGSPGPNHGGGPGGNGGTFNITGSSVIYGAGGSGQPQVPSQPGTTNPTCGGPSPTTSGAGGGQSLSGGGRGTDGRGGGGAADNINFQHLDQMQVDLEWL